MYYIIITLFLYLSPDVTTEKVYIMLEDRLEALFKTTEEYVVMEQMKGETLVGRKYQPLFPYFAHLKSSEPDKGAFRVVRCVKCVCVCVCVCGNMAHAKNVHVTPNTNTNHTHHRAHPPTVKNDTTHNTNATITTIATPTIDHTHPQ